MKLGDSSLTLRMTPLGRSLLSWTKWRILCFNVFWKEGNNNRKPFPRLQNEKI